MKKTIITIALSLITIVAFAGGGWPQKKGKGYYKLYQWWVVADRHFTDVGLIDPNVTGGNFNTSIYAEYGITNRLTGVINMPFFSRAFMNSLVSGTTGDVIVQGEAINSFGDTDLGIKYGLTKPSAKIAVAASLTLGIPFGKSSGGSQGNLQTGDGEFNQIIQIDAGKSFGKIKNKVSLYGNAYVGFNNRTKGFSDEFRYGVELGGGFIKDKLWLITRIIGVESFKNGKKASDQTTSTSIFANNTAYTSFSLEAAYYIKPKFGISVNTAGAFRGRIIYAAPSYSVGVFLHLR